MPMHEVFLPRTWRARNRSGVRAGDYAHMPGATRTSTRFPKTRRLKLRRPDVVGIRSRHDRRANSAAQPKGASAHDRDPRPCLARSWPHQWRPPPRTTSSVWLPKFDPRFRASRRCVRSSCASQRKCSENSTSRRHDSLRNASCSAPPGRRPPHWPKRETVTRKDSRNSSPGSAAGSRCERNRLAVRNRPAATDGDRHVGDAGIRPPRPPGEPDGTTQGSFHP